jgi:hypothetical protein
VTDGNIKSFERTANKYGIDYALKKDTSEQPPRYLVFFKGRDVDVMTQAFKEFSAKTVKQKEKQSLKQKLSRSRSSPKPSTRRRSRSRRRIGALSYEKETRHQNARPSQLSRMCSRSILWTRSLRSSDWLPELS